MLLDDLATIVGKVITGEFIFCGYNFVNRNCPTKARQNESNLRYQIVKYGQIFSLESDCSVVVFRLYVFKRNKYRFASFKALGHQLFWSLINEL